jgi:ubiquinone/menaquinone biosynthesis C-methylase UbiE
MTSNLTIDDPGYFERLADVESAHWWSLGMWRLAMHWLTTALNGRSGLRALDVGCGTGMTVARLAARPQIGDVVGLDVSHAALELARPRADRWVRGSARALPFAAGCFDLVTCFDVLQHLPAGADRQAVSELRRVLRKGGLALLRANGRLGSSRLEAGGTVYRLDQLSAVIESSGLRVVRASYANCLPALVAEIRGCLRLSSLSSRAVQGHPAGGGLRNRVPSPAINRVMGRISASEAFVAGRLGITLPFGHSTLVLAERG